MVGAAGVEAVDGGVILVAAQLPVVEVGGVAGADPGLHLALPAGPEADGEPDRFGEPARPAVVPH